jgi:protein subunit release factor A
MKKIITISAGEGGADARLFVSDLSTAYKKLSIRKG